MNTNKQLVIGLIIAIIFGGGGYYIGAHSRTKALPERTAGGFGAQQGMRANGMGGARSGGAVAGDIISKDATSITVKLQNGGSQIVLISGSTTVSKTAEGTPDDLTTGEQVFVTGTTNSDGSVSAQNIRLGAVRMP